MLWEPGFINTIANTANMFLCFLCGEQTPNNIHRRALTPHAINIFLFELMGKRFSYHSHFVSVADYISNKVSGMIRPLHPTEARW